MHHQNYDAASIYGFLGTVSLAFIGKILHALQLFSLRDWATVTSIMAGVTMTALNLKNILKKKSK